MANAEHTAEHASEPRAGDALGTYRSLRLALVLLAVMLAFSVLFDRASTTCWLSSVSAYYYSAAGDVFVFVLAAAGVLMVVYQGNTDTENVLLDLAGAMATVVALVPVAPDLGCPATVSAAGPAAREPRVTNGVWALLLMGVLSVLVWQVVSRRSGGSRSLSPRARIAAVVSVLVIAGQIGYFWVDRDGFVAHDHYVAAVALFGAIVAVVLANAHGLARAGTPSPSMGDYANRYALIAGTLVATLVVLVLVHLALPGWSHWVLVLEAGLIAQFAVFWAVQTAELWDVTCRPVLAGR